MKPPKARHFTKIHHSWQPLIPSNASSVKRPAETSSPTVPSKKVQTGESQSTLQKIKQSPKGGSSPRANHSRQQLNSSRNMNNNSYRSNGGGGPGRISKLNRNYAKTNQPNLYVPPPRRGTWLSFFVSSLVWRVLFAWFLLVRLYRDIEWQQPFLINF